MLPEEWVVLGNAYWETLGVVNNLTDLVFPTNCTALDFCNILTTEPEEGCVGNVGVPKLAPLHQIMGVQLLGSIHIRHNFYGFKSGGGKSLTRRSLEWRSTSSHNGFFRFL